MLADEAFRRCCSPRRSYSAVSRRELDKTRIFQLRYMSVIEGEVELLDRSVVRVDSRPFLFTLGDFSR